MRGRLSPFALLLALLACHGYRPVEPGPPAPGTEVRAALSPDEARRLDRAELLSAGDVVEGVVEEADARSLTLSVRRPELRGVERFGTARDTVTLSTAGLRSLEARRLKPVPTAAVAVAAAGGMVGLFAVLMEGAGREGDENLGGQDPRLVLRIPVGR